MKGFNIGSQNAKTIINVNKDVATKTIFVTVAEFLENGGELINDRDLFTKKHSEAPLIKVGTFAGFPERYDDMIGIQRTDRGIMLYKNQVWIETPCTPHYI